MRIATILAFVVHIACSAANAGSSDKILDALVALEEDRVYYAIDILEGVKDENEAYAHYCLGMLYRDNIHMPTNIDLSDKHLLRASALGSCSAMRVLANGILQKSGLSEALAVSEHTEPAICGDYASKVFVLLYGFSGSDIREEFEEIYEYASVGQMHAVKALVRFAEQELVNPIAPEFINTMLNAAKYGNIDAYCTVKKYIHSYDKKSKNAAMEVISSLSYTVNDVIECK